MRCLRAVTQYVVHILPGCTGSCGCFSSEGAGMAPAVSTWMAKPPALASRPAFAILVDASNEILVDYSRIHSGVVCFRGG